MSTQEKKQILKMVEEGKITPEEAIDLIDALDEDIAEGAEDAFSAEAGPTFGGESGEGLDAIAEKVRGFWYIPLWIGTGVTVLGGLFMFWAMRASGFGFWFYCSWLPFLLGILVIALAAGSRTSRWLFLRVKQAPGEKPKNITLGFPLPLGLAGWGLRNFGHMIPQLDKTGVDEILLALDEMPSGDAPLIVDVHDEEDGEHVQVFIG